MPAWFSAILMESGEVKWQQKRNASVSESGPDDHKLVIEFEGDLDKVPWVIDISCQKATIDMDKLIASNRELFDKEWLQYRGYQEASLSAIGHHHVFEIDLSRA
ncbi:MAG TPA: hypothetical protein VHO68_10605 [Bacteroidales bacterium]|nr:hypothetical protein [Bacteroidales bacterium]